MSLQKGKKFSIIFVLLLLLGLCGTYFYYAETEMPRITISPKEGFVREKSPVRLVLNDAKSGLSLVRVEVVQQGKSRSLLHQELGKGVHDWQSKIRPGGQGLEQGDFLLRVTARDRSWRNWFAGNRVVQEYRFVLDNQSPQINLETFRHNLNRWGAGLVRFTVSEPLEKTGVKIRKYFFPAYKGSDNQYTCLFAFPYDLDPGRAEPVIQAVDRAGNEKQTGFHYRVNSKEFEQTTIEVPKRFLQTKMAHFQDLYPAVTNNLDLFLKVNKELRSSNREKLKQIGLDTVSKPLWTDRFLRQKGARKSGFASHRTYYYQGREIDHETHLGIDIASLARAEVKAANSGRVVYSDWLGIYGQVIILDHGLGLQTLYAHLSERKVQPGDRVKKGESIGRTGATGLAGGDHLHFAVLISGVPVNPIEWWDLNWVKNNVSAKLSGLEPD